MTTLPISKPAIMAFISLVVSTSVAPASACDDPPGEWDCDAKNYGAPCGEVSPEYRGGITHHMVLNIQDGKYIAEIANTWTKDTFVVTGSSLQDLQRKMRDSDDVRGWMQIKVVAKSVKRKREKVDINLGNPYKVDWSTLKN